jgi:hemerythrin-like domain-containing protein
MSRPTHLLRHEHRIIEQGMRALEGMCIRMQTGSSVPGEELSKLLDFIRNFADRFHHEKEETHFFPALERIGIQDDTGALAFLRNEHKTERRLLAELELVAEDYHHNYGAIESFVQVARQYKDHLIGHMQQEESILFRLAEEMLDDEVKDSLTHALAAGTPTTREMIRRYEKLARELEEAWSV